MTSSNKSACLHILIVLAIIASYIVGAYVASTGHAQGDGQGRIGTYQFQVLNDTDRNEIQPFLVDTRMGEVYIAREANPKVSARWVRYIPAPSRPNEPAPPHRTTP